MAQVLVKRKGSVIRKHKAFSFIIILLFVAFSFIYIHTETKTAETDTHGLPSSQLHVKESREDDKIRYDYYSEDGKLTYASDLHYATVVKTFDSDGNVLLEQYYDENGNPAEQSAKHFALRNEYDLSGNNTLISYLDADLNPLMNQSGYAFRKRNFNDLNQCTEDRYYDTKWNPVEVSTGNYAILREYDEQGNNHIIRYLGKNDEPVLINSGFAKVVRTFDESGRVASEKYFGTDEKPIAIGLGQYGEAYVYNDDGKKTLISYLDAEGNLMLNNKGYASVERTFDKDGNLYTERFLGLSGEPVEVDGKYGNKRENGEWIDIDINGNEQVSLNEYLYDHPYFIMIIAFLLCFAAILLPWPLRIVLLVLYIAFIVNMTLLFRENGDPKGEFDFFWSYSQFFTNSYLRTEILENIWLFIPLGAILYSIFNVNADPYLKSKRKEGLSSFAIYNKKGLVLLFPFFLSFTIEIIQLVFGLGLFEFDDMISNTLGGVIGYLIAYVLSTLIPVRRENSKEKAA